VELKPRNNPSRFSLWRFARWLSTGICWLPSHTIGTSVQHPTPSDRLTRCSATNDNLELIKCAAVPRMRSGSLHYHPSIDLLQSPTAEESSLTLSLRPELNHHRTLEYRHSRADDIRLWITQPQTCGTVMCLAVWLWGSKRGDEDAVVATTHASILSSPLVMFHQS
jgi:hypothetical protein